MHFFVRFEPRLGKETEFHEEMLRVIQITQTEADCLAIHAFESLREPFTFGIYAEWVDEAAFERHAQLPHTVRFIRAAENLLTHSVQGLRMQRIGPPATPSTH
jgi:quinol monooxygenase YgiN